MMRPTQHILHTHKPNAAIRAFPAPQNARHIFWHAHFARDFLACIIQESGG